MLAQAGHMASVNILDKFWDEKLMPTIDLTCIHSLNSWIMLRTVCADYGRKYFYRHEIFMPIMFGTSIFNFVVILEVRLFGIINYLDARETEKFFILLIIEFSSFMVLTISILQMASRINKKFSQHRELISNNLNVFREIFEFRRFYFKEFLQEKPVARRKNSPITRLTSSGSDIEEEAVKLNPSVKGNDVLDYLK